MAEQFRGVNLGGWLVLEKWLTPSVFTGTDAIDEHTLSLTVGGKQRIRTHRRTFVTKADFRWLAEHGITHVRIPVGYWVFEPLDGYIPCARQLDHAMRWAEEYGLQVLIDLHAARGSQNGFDNSGHRGAAEWFTRSDYQQQTLIVLEQIAHRYGNSSALWGIELLNEPTPTVRQHRILRRFHRQAYDRLHSILPVHIAIVFHDAFHSWLSASTFWRYRRHSNHPIIMDCHWYAFSFTGNNLAMYLQRSARLRRLLLRFLQLWQPVLVGEWSSVLPQRFFDATPREQHYALLGRNVAMQQQAYRHAAGWYYWNYKADGDGMWNFRSLVESGVFVL